MNLPQIMGLLSPLLSKPMDDSMVKSLVAQVETTIEPLFQDARRTIAIKIAGDAPHSFYVRATKMFSFTREQVQELWLASVEAMADEHHRS